jgi:hypothetical protein
MDDRIAELKKEVDGKRQILTSLADPRYRGARGKDFEIDVSERPITDTLQKFNDGPRADHVLIWVETSAGGRFAELDSGWCPWPFTGRFGTYWGPADIKGAFFAGVYIDKLEYLSWKAGNGFEYALKTWNLEFGYMLVLEYVEFCFGSAPVFLHPVVVVDIPCGITPGGACSIQDVTGDTVLTPVPDQGISYVLKLRDPLILIVNFSGIIVPLPSKPKLLSGQLQNALGKPGEVHLGNGKVLKYLLDTNFDQASFVERGLITSGSLVIHW